MEGEEWELGASRSSLFHQVGEIMPVVGGNEANAEREKTSAKRWSTHLSPLIQTHLKLDTPGFAPS